MKTVLVKTISAVLFLDVITSFSGFAQEAKLCNLLGYCVGDTVRGGHEMQIKGFYPDGTVIGTRNGSDIYSWESDLALLKRADGFKDPFTDPTNDTVRLDIKAESVAVFDDAKEACGHNLDSKHKNQELTAYNQLKEEALRTCEKNSLENCRIGSIKASPKTEQRSRLGTRNVCFDSGCYLPFYLPVPTTYSWNQYSCELRATVKGTRKKLEKAARPFQTESDEKGPNASVSAE